MTALRELIEAVESDDLDGAVLISALSPSLGYDEAIEVGISARLSFNGSLDAAESLHEALLPGWRWEGYDQDGWCVWLSGDANNPFRAEATKPSRAWLLAILRAYEAQQEGKG